MVSESYFAQFMTSHKPAFVNISVHTAYASFTSVLPHSNVVTVFQSWFFVRILSNPQRVAV